ncbi:DUF4142 domain-containing protein [Ramlibacter terrae]|uniref:DUF4142 domain-containing protein n=1 Tax=Ramlibacter terrae TaxID=2732511 RepID=A0ABX6P379_9BURK|nr:DUF4142 domain-containing protein [Ramlibacter terrae]
MLARSSSPAVKELATALVERRQAVQPEILRLLHARGMAMPLPENDHGKVLKQLAKLNGAKLDRVYIEEVVQRSAQADVANHEKLAGLAEDPVLKAGSSGSCRSCATTWRAPARRCPVPRCALSARCSRPRASGRRCRAWRSPLPAPAGSCRTCWRTSR